MKITLHQLKVFEVVATLGSITQAAQSLHMTQPAVSNIIRQLEEYYDCPLIEVISRKLHLTVFGKVVLSLSQEIRKTLDTKHSEIKLIKGCVSGTLSVATVSTAKYFVPHLLGNFKTEHPDVHIKMKVGNREEIIARLEKNTDDFVIMSQPPTNIPVECADFYEDELVIVSSPSHSLLKKKNLSLNSLANEAWIIREEGSGTRIAMSDIFKKHHFSPRIEMEIDNNESIKHAIMANMGISLVSKQSIKVELKAKLLAIMPVKSFPIRHEWHLVKNSGKKLSPIAEKFYAFVTAHKPKFSEFHAE